MVHQEHYPDSWWGISTALSLMMSDATRHMQYIRRAEAARKQLCFVIARTLQLLDYFKTCDDRYIAITPVRDDDGTTRMVRRGLEERYTDSQIARATRGLLKYEKTLLSAGLSHTCRPAESHIRYSLSHYVNFAYMETWAAWAACATSYYTWPTSGFFSMSNIMHVISPIPPLQTYIETIDPAVTNHGKRILRDIWHPIYSDDPHKWLEPRWLTSSVLDVARAIFLEDAYNRMPILGDALMDAGCDNEDVLYHCVHEQVHQHGCWLIDALLGFSACR